MNDMFKDMTSPTIVPALEANMRDFWMAYGDGPECDTYDSPELTQFVTGIPHPFFNAAFDPRLTAATTDVVMMSAIACAAARQVPLF